MRDFQRSVLPKSRSGPGANWRWTPEADEYLKANWASMPAKDIGHNLVLKMPQEGSNPPTKNAVIGRAHRLGLPRKQRVASRNGVRYSA